MTIQATDVLESCDALTSGQDMTTILVNAKAFIADSSRWTTWAQARDARGVKVLPGDPTACCWCIEGAVGIAANTFGVIPPSVLRFLDLCVQEYYGLDCAVGEFNDSVTHEVVLEFMDRAIQRSMEINGHT